MKIRLIIFYKIEINRLLFVNYKMNPAIKKLNIDHFTNIIDKLTLFRSSSQCTASDVAIVSRDFYSYTKLYMNKNYKYINYIGVITRLKNSVRETKTLKSLCNKLNYRLGLNFDSIKDFNKSIQWGQNYRLDQEWLDAIDPVMNNIELSMDEDKLVDFWNNSFRNIWLKEMHGNSPLW